MTVDIARLSKLIEAFETSDWDEIHLKGDDFEIRLSTSADGPPAAAPFAPVAAAPATPPPVEISAPAPAAGVSGNGAGAAVPAPAADPAPAAVATPAAAPAAGAAAATGAAGETVVSPSVGIFWRAPSPTSPPFVEVGDEVTADSTLCILEVMKLMTQVGPGMTGRVVDILVSNGEPVEKGQPLFTVQPA